MALPKLVTPEFDTVIPSTKEAIKFRPFLVKEEKVLFMALESGEQNDIYNAVISILDSCILTKGIKKEKLASYDLEYLFLKLRAKSVGETIELKLKHLKPEFAEKCSHATPVMINVDDIEVKYDETHEYTVDLGGGVGIQLSDPKISDLIKLEAAGGQMEQMLEVVCNSIDMFYDENDIYQDFTIEEAREFIDNLTKDNFEKITSFFDTMPKLTHEIIFTCPECGETETIKLEGMQSFFT